MLGLGCSGKTESSLGLREGVPGEQRVPKQRSAGEPPAGRSRLQIDSAFPAAPNKPEPAAQTVPRADKEVWAGGSSGRSRQNHLPASSSC